MILTTNVHGVLSAKSFLPILRRADDGSVYYVQHVEIETKDGSYTVTLFSDHAASERELAANPMLPAMHIHPTHDIENEEVGG